MNKEILSLDIHYNQFHITLKQKSLLTTSLIGVKVSCALANVCPTTALTNFNMTLRCNYNKGIRILSLDIQYNQFHTRLKQKPLLTTALIGVKVSCPLAKVHGRPADCKFPVCECDKKNIKRLCVCFRIKGHGGQLMLQVCKQKYTEQKTLCEMKHIG